MLQATIWQLEKQQRLYARALEDLGAEQKRREEAERERDQARKNATLYYRNLTASAVTRIGLQERVAKAAATAKDLIGYAAGSDHKWMIFGPKLQQIVEALTVANATDGEQAPALRPVVAAFAHAMELKLRGNDHKSCWSGLEIAYLLERLDEEVAELKEALASEGSEAVTSEAADVANFAMMLADVFDRDTGGPSGTISDRM